MPEPETVADLARCPIFRGLEPGELDRIWQLLEPVSYSGGATILNEGQSTRFLWIIVRGRCRVLKETAGGSAQQLAVLEPWSVFGELSFFHPAPHSASVVAASQVDLLRLSHAAFDTLRSRDASTVGRIALNSLEIVSERLRKMDEWVGNLIERPEAAAHREEWRDFRAKLFAEWAF